ncbi:MAG TPA: alkaline phosphatase [Dysgonamonadaceae bacterium]|nr:alkaline phosphatase [Dysgonamonadaceae bacterium]
MKKWNLVFSLTLAVLFLTLPSGCGKSKYPQMKNPPKHVILIGFDGMSANSLKNGVDMPTYRSMMKEGSYTLKNRSVLPSSSAPNWASIFMGAPPELHGFNTWGSEKPDFPSRELTENNLFPDIFYLIRQVKPKAEIGHIYEWGGMYYLADNKSIDYIRQATLSGIDIKNAVAPAVEYITSKKPNFLAIIFDEPDGVGHREGWESETYINMLNHLDNALQVILDAVQEAGMMDETVFVLVSDHGGKDKGHGGPTLDEMETPIVFYGKGIKSDFELPESTMVYDIAATIGYMFGVDQPQVWIGRPIMSVFSE